MRFYRSISSLIMLVLILLLPVNTSLATQQMTSGVTSVRLKIEKDMQRASEEDGVRSKPKRKRVIKRSNRSQNKLKRLEKEIEIRKLKKEIKELKNGQKIDEEKFKKAGEKEKKKLIEKMEKDELLRKHYQDQLRELSRNKSSILWIAVAIVSALLIAIILIVYLKKKSIKDVKNEKEAAMIAMKESQNELGKIRDDQRRKKETPNMLLEGETPEGESITIKLSGELLGRKEGLIIGRNPAMSTYIIDHPEVSRKHFRLIMVSDQLMIEDLGSTNGIKLDGEQIDAHELEVLLLDTEISMGDLKLNLHNTG